MMLSGLGQGQEPEQQGAAAPQQAIATPKHAALAQDPQLVTGRLENGLSYIIRPTKEPAGRASVRLYVKVGSLHETDENSGISHFLEHMVFNGSKHFKRGELIPTMQKLGLGFGGDANAYTGLLQTVYMLDLPNLEEETVDFAFTIMRDFADGATLEGGAIDHERGIVVSELKARDSAGYRAMLEMLAQMTEGTRVAKYMPIGKEEVIRDAPYEIVRDYYHDHYVPERMTVIITGDVKPETAEQWVRKHFESMEARESKPAPALGELKKDIINERIIPNPEAGQCTIMASVIRPYEEKKDTLEQRMEDLPLQLALSMLNRRFSRLTKQADCPFTAAAAEDEEFFHASEYTGVTVLTDAAKWQESLGFAVSQMRQAIKHGFDAAELQEAATGLITNLQHACETWDTVPAKTMATALVRAQDPQQVITTPQEDLRAAQLGLERIMANPDLCRQALERNFDAARAALTMSGELPEGITKEQLRAAYNQALQAEIPEPNHQNVKPFAYDTIGMPGVVMQQKQLEKLGVTTITLSNGVKINLKPIDFREGSISVAAAVDGGLMSLPDTPGLATMIGAVMRQGGLQEHSMDELQRLFSGNQVRLNFSMTPTRFIYSGETNLKDLELQCKLIAAAIMHPGFRNEGEIMLRRSLSNRYKELTTKPEGASAMQMGRALFGNDPRFVIPEQAEVEARSTQEVRDTLTPLLRNNALEVSLVGDFKPEEALPVLERTFGAMPQRREEFNRIPDVRRHVEFKPWGQRAFLRYPTELDKTIVSQVHPAGNGRDMHRNRRLKVLVSIVREKLFDGLRAAMGESYSPRVRFVENSEYDNAAYIECISAGVKGNRAKVSAAMESICNGIGQGQISQEDFDCAIRPIISAVEKDLISPEFWESGLLDIQSNPQRAGLMSDILDDVKSINLEEIRELAKEVFGKDNTNFYYVVPENYEESDEASAPAAEPADELGAINTPAPGEYLVITTRGTADLADWKNVADTLAQKYPDASLTVLPELTEDSCAQAIREKGARYVAYVLRPEEVNRVLVNALHRAARKVDSDPYGDCMWGIVTGYRAADAQRIADAKAPLVIRRVLSTTNVGPDRFEHSYCITDWEGFPVLEQTGYTKPTETRYTNDTPEGQDIQENGIQGKFAYQLSTQKPQLIVTSSHATPFNLEMPFSKGLIFSANNRFYQMGCKQLITFSSALRPAMEGKTGALQSLAEAMQFPVIEPDKTERVWLAAGNCLFGDARSTDQSMAITALSAYNCNQLIGYTVPSWYGEAGWGTLGLFMGNTDNTTLAEAFFLNNQFIIAKTISLDAKLLQVHFNEPEIGPALQRDLNAAHIAITNKQAKDAVGLVHDRDTLAFYGDPAWAAIVDHSQAHAPLTLSWQGDESVTITANYDYEGRAAIWFPSAEIGKKYAACDMKDAIFTNDFILIPTLKLKKGESAVIRLIPHEQTNS